MICPANPENGEMQDKERAAAALRRAADTLESHVVSDRNALVCELVALHIIRACGDARMEDEARLLVRLLG